MLLFSSFPYLAGGIIAILSGGTLADDTSTLPHPSCRILGNDTLICSTGNYSIPGNVDLSLIPKNISDFRLGKGASAGSSIIHDNAEPFPKTASHVTSLSLSGFTGTNGTRVPVEAFLVNVREQLVRFRLFDCRIGGLGSDFLRGFHNLQILDLGFNDIREIALAAFDARGKSDSNPSVLRSISLNGNYISVLDWTVFAPVASSLMELYLHLQQQWPGQDSRLTNLTLSTPFKFANLTTLSMRHNTLEFPLRGILDTLNIKEGSFIDLEDNAFCTATCIYQECPCACCEAEEFVRWTYEVANKSTPHRPFKLSFTCGFGLSIFQPWTVFPTNATLPSLEQYERCTASKATGGLVATTEPTGSAAAYGSAFAGFSLVFWFFLSPSLVQ